MLAAHIIEESYSSYVNSLTLVQRHGKRVRIYLDAREANKFMSPDWANAHPMQMLLRRFHGASYISTLDLSSNLLQIPLKKPQGNGQLSSSRTRCTNLHTYHMVSEILPVLLLGHFNRYSGLIPLNTFFIILMTAYERNKKKASEKLYFFILYCIELYFIV